MSTTTFTRCGCLDGVTAYNELRASEHDLGVQGTALWRLGSSDTSLWPSGMRPRADAADRQKLADLPPGPDLILEGEGDIWHITDTPKERHNVPSNTMRRAIFSPTNPTTPSALLQH